MTKNILLNLSWFGVVIATMANIFSLWATSRRVDTLSETIKVLIRLASLQQETDKAILKIIKENMDTPNA